jgi:hypothetical protein
MKKLYLLISILLFCTVHLMAQDVAITVYNQNRALVRESRDLSVKSGKSTLSFTNVAAQIDPTSVYFKSLSQPDKLAILEQNFEYDLVNANKILQKYVDESIRIVMEKGEQFEGKLLNATGSNIVIQDIEGGIKIVQGNQIQHFDFPSLPEGLITRPTLVWLVNNTGLQKQKTEVSYLTSGMNWHAEYVAVTDVKDENLDLSGWVSIENQCGITFENAKLKLVAGDVHLVSESRGRRIEALADKRAMTLAAEPQFEEKSFFEYHLYTLQRKTTLKNNQTKQVSLFPSTTTKTKKIFVYDGARYGEKVRVNLEFKNSKKDGLGIPLPKGKIRVYKEDTDGALEFIGEDEIDHTPKDEDVRIFLGNAFDLVGERTQTSSEKISRRSRKDAFEIVLKNHKEEAVRIVVVEHFWGDWTLSDTTHPYKKKDAFTAEFEIPVPADGEVTLKYTVTMKW